MKSDPIIIVCIQDASVFLVDFFIDKECTRFLICLRYVLLATMYIRGSITTRELVRALTIMLVIGLVMRKFGSICLTIMYGK